MKIKAILILLISASMLVAFQQGEKGKQKEKTIRIRDLRTKGLYAKDMSPDGHKEGDVSILIITTEIIGSARGLNPLDTINYKIQFFKKYQGKMLNYGIGITGHEICNKASYIWLTDSTVSITLFNSKNKKSQTLKLQQNGNKTDFLN